MIRLKGIEANCRDSYGGREASLAAQAKGEAQQIGVEGKAAAKDAVAGAEKLVDQTKQKAGDLKDRLTK